MLQLLIGSGGGDEETFAVALTRDSESACYSALGSAHFLAAVGGEGILTQLSSARLSVCLLWSRGKWVSRPVAPLRTHCTMHVRFERPVSRARGFVPIEVLRGANGDDGIGICECREYPDPNPPRQIIDVSVKRPQRWCCLCVSIVGWRGKAHSFEFSNCARTAMLACSTCCFLFELENSWL